MTEKHSPLPWKAEDDQVINTGGYLLVAECHGGDDDEAFANAALIVRSVNALPEAVAALEDLHQKAGVVATWLNHWDVSFADEDEWRGPTGDGKLFFDALNRAATALTKLKG